MGKKSKKNANKAKNNKGGASSQGQPRPATTATPTPSVEENSDLEDAIDRAQVALAVTQVKGDEESKAGGEEAAIIVEKANAAAEMEAGTKKSKEQARIQAEHYDQAVLEALNKVEERDRLRAEQEAEAFEAVQKAKERVVQLLEVEQKAKTAAEDLKRTDEQARRKAEQNAKAVAEALEKAKEEARLKAEQDAKVAEAVHRAKERVRLQAEQNTKEAAKAAQKAEEQARRKAETLATLSSPPKSASPHKSASPPKSAPPHKSASKALGEVARLLRAVEEGIAATKVINKAEQDTRQGVPSPIAKRGTTSLAARYGAKSPKAKLVTTSPVAMEAEEHTEADVETSNATKEDMEAIAPVANGVASPAAKHAKSNVEISKSARVPSPIAKRGTTSLAARYGAKSPKAKLVTTSPVAMKAEEHTEADVETSNATKEDMEAIAPVANGVASPAAKHAKSNVEISKSAEVESEKVAKTMEQYADVKAERLKMNAEERKVDADDDGSIVKVEAEKKTDADYLTQDATTFGEELLRKAEEEARKAEEDMDESMLVMNGGHEDTEEEITSRGGRHVSSGTNVSPVAAGLRWVILAAICLVMASTSYSYDIPAALHAQLQEYMEDHSKEQFEVEFNLLYTVYSIPNIILPFIGGALVDQLGASFMVPILSSFCVVGQALFTLGATRKHWRLMLLGRIVYGVGGESTYVACSTVLSQWFAGKEMAFAFGLAMALCKLGSVFNNLLSPVVAESKTTPSALWVGLGVNSLGLILGIFILSLDRNFRRRPRPVVVDGNDDSLTEPLLPGIGTETEIPDSTPIEASSTHIAGRITRMSSLFWLLSLSCLVVYGCVLPFNNVASAILLERNYFKTPPDDCQLLYSNECTSGTLQDHPNPSTDSNGHSCPGPHYAPILPTSLNITRIGHAYRKEPLSHVEVDCEVSFWSHGCTKDYCEASDRASLTADRVMSIPYIVSAIISPVLGGIVDKVGRRALLAFLAPLVLIMVHMALALSDASPILPLLGQGLSYALFGAVLWPSVPLTVEPCLAGTAFGIINSIQNIGLGVFPLVVAGIHNQAGQYLPHVEYFFCACAFMGGLVGIWLNLLDRKHGNKLNSVDGKGDVEESPSPARGAEEEVNVSEIV